jgi:hypothetical protein
MLSHLALAEAGDVDIFLSTDESLLCVTNKINLKIKAANRVSWLMELMNGNIAMNFRNPATVREAGMIALKKELGTVGAMYFLRQFSAGHGDYTAERERLLDGIGLDEIVKSVRALDQKTPYSCCTAIGQEV